MMLVVLIVESLLPLWIFVIVGGCSSLAMMCFVIWQQKGAATKQELHEEVGGLERKVDARFERERAISRDANAKIYNRINDTAQEVTRSAARLESMNDMLKTLVDKKLKE